MSDQEERPLRKCDCCYDLTQRHDICDECYLVEQYLSLIREKKSTKPLTKKAET